MKPRRDKLKTASDSPNFALSAPTIVKESDTYSLLYMHMKTVRTVEGISCFVEGFLFFRKRFLVFRRRKFLDFGRDLLFLLFISVQENVQKSL